MSVGDVDETAGYLMSLDLDDEALLLVRQAEERTRLLSFVRSLALHDGSDPTQSVLAAEACKVLDTLGVPVVCDAVADGRHRIDPRAQRCTACCGLAHRIGKSTPGITAEDD
ncbi:hypothetical protein ACWDG9_16530 [Streptomyces sp. NPDC001073]